MDAAARRLGWFALFLAFVAVAVLSVTAPGTGSVTTYVWNESRAAFASGSWHWLIGACGVAIALAVVTALAEIAVAPRAASSRVELGSIEGGSLREALVEIRKRIQDAAGGARVDVVGGFDQLLRGAVSLSASDIHISPTPSGLKLTYRVHGTLHDVATLPLEVGAPLATRVKVLARLDTYVHGAPQDGRLVVDVDGGSVEARVSTLPTEIGERIVLRLVRGSRTVPDLDALGFGGQVQEGLKSVLARPQGLLFVTGPVGSGKTTTLYSSLKHIAGTRGRTTSLVTLEDPIELELPFATQTQMHPRAGMTFASVLRSVLRQDPNVLMVGEIRDRETADIAMQAGLTGHLILTTVHGESAAGPFARLIDMGVEPFVLASATVGCLSQRLVRTLCTACRREAQPEPLIVERFMAQGVVLSPARYYEPVGCDFCEGQGFTGRLPIGELLVVDTKLRALVNERHATRELYDAAVAEGMTPILRDGLSRAERGETSLAEVLRVVG